MYYLYIANKEDLTLEENLKLQQISACVVYKPDQTEIYSKIKIDWLNGTSLEESNYYANIENKQHNHSYILYFNTSKEISADVCFICILPLGEEGMVKLQCGHLLHSVCCGQLVNFSLKCPVCRKYFL